MAKRKPAPKAPPQSVADVLLDECMKKITPAKVSLYAGLVFRQPGSKQPSKREAQATLEAVMDFANLGWTYYHGHKERQEGPR